jgi:hypothetical protein
MKPTSYWVMQYLFATTTLLGVLLAVDVGQGTALVGAWPSCLAWAAVASALFTGSRYRQYRKGIACALCVEDERI